ncbi:RodZ domain-containing protein [Halovibrio salipaludis]|nr:RodZ domain-containing protein [Halovibrio salipaludis]
MSEEGSAENSNGPTTRLVGEQLRTAREHHGMDRQDVADQLHLRPSIIQAIEESDYEAMPADLFLKGYVRTYARLTEQDGDDLIARLDRELEPYRERQEAQQEPSPTEIIRQKKIRRRRIGGMTIAALAVLLLGWVLYEYGPWVVDSAVEAVGEVEFEVPDADSGSEADAESGSDSEPEPASATDEGDTTEAGSSEAGMDTDPAFSTPVAQVESPGAAPPNGGSRMDAAGQAGGRQSSLTITFDGACWVEVVNGNGERVVVTLAQEGETVDYEGPAPFEVLLGNVDAVASVRFMGEAVDLEQYPVNAGRTQFVLDTANG